MSLCMGYKGKHWKVVSSEYSKINLGHGYNLKIGMSTFADLSLWGLKEKDKPRLLISQIGNGWNTQKSRQKEL